MTTSGPSDDGQDEDDDPLGNGDAPVRDDDDSGGSGGTGGAPADGGRGGAVVPDAAPQPSKDSGTSLAFDAAAGADAARDMAAPAAVDAGVLYTTDFEQDLGAVLPADPHWTQCRQDGSTRALCVDGGDRPIFLNLGSDWKDYVAEVSFNIPRGGATLYVRSRGARDNYGFELKWDGQNKLFTLWRLLNGQQSSLRSGRIDWPFNAWVRLRVRVKGGDITFAAKTDPAGSWQELGTVTDASHASGGVGFKTHSIPGRFDDLLVLPAP